MHFGDTDTAAKVMTSTDPVEQKKLGKSIAGFDLEDWQKVAPDIITKGLIAKFTQVPHCKVFLKATINKIIGEANPNDSFWGIGMGLQDTSVWDQMKWGKNHLGKLLMKVRAEI